LRTRRRTPAQPMVVLPAFATAACYQRRRGLSRAGGYYKQRLQRRTPFYRAACWANDNRDGCHSRVGRSLHPAILLPYAHPCRAANARRSVICTAVGDGRPSAAMLPATQGSLHLLAATSVGWLAWQHGAAAALLRLPHPIAAIFFRHMYCRAICSATIYTCMSCGDCLGKTAGLGGIAGRQPRLGAGKDARRGRRFLLPRSSTCSAFSHARAGWPLMPETPCGMASHRHRAGGPAHRLPLPRPVFCNLSCFHLVPCRV